MHRSLLATARLRDLSAFLFLGCFGVSGMDPFPNHTVDSLAIDRATWVDILNEFNGEPLSVPRGELRLLQWMFPGFNEALPVTQAKLQKYEPWSLAEIELFFQDYPSLRKFRPILSFESIPGTELGSVWMNSEMKDDFRPGNQRIRLKSARPDFLKINAGVNCGETYLRWRRRFVSVEPLGIPLEVVVGNYSLSLSDGLFYGYFPTIPAAYENVGDNWKYGYTPNWNGLLLATEIGETVVLESALHVRPSEAGALLKAEMAIRKNLEIYIGGSGMRTSADNADNADTSIVLHWGGAFDHGLASVAIHSGYRFKNAGLPFLLELSIGKSDTRFDFAFLRYPFGVRPARSHLRRRFEHLLKSTDTVSIFGLEVTGKREFNGLVKLRTRTLGSGMGAQTAVDHTGEISLLRPFPASLEYRLFASTVNEGVRRELLVGSSTPSGKKFGASIRSRFVVSDTGKRTIHNELNTELRLGPTVKITPGIKSETDISNASESTFLFENTYHAVLFDKTYARAKLAIPLFQKDEKGFTLHVGTGFGI